MEDYVNYEVRSPEMTVAWFLIRWDAETFIKGLALKDPTTYTVHEVNKIVKENN